MPSGSPSTLLARWPSANPSSAIPVLGRALTTSRPGLSTGRRAVQIRPFRLPASDANGPDGRAMYVVRHLDGSSDRVDVFVEDPAAKGARVEAATDKGKGRARDGEDEVMARQEDDENGGSGAVAHSRWTHCAVGLPPGTTSTSAPPPGGGGAGALFDTFIQRALLAPPAPGGQPAPQRDPAAWQPRAQAVSLEGYTFVVGGGAGAGSVGAGADWEVKVSSVGLKGGSASGTTRGCLIEVTYLPVPYLPAGSTFVHDFVLSLFPPAAVKNGEIELVSIGEDVFVDVGLLDPPVDEGDEGRWEWRTKHSTFAYVHQFKKEGLL